MDYFSINGEKLFLQFLMATFAFSFIYIVCRSMRICEKQYKKTAKRIKKLKARIDVVLSQHVPMCDLVLYRNAVRYRHSFVAGYLKDLINENRYEPEKCLDFFQNFPQSSSSKHVSDCSTMPSESFDLSLKLNNAFPGKESNEHSDFEKLGSSDTKKSTQNEDIKSKEIRKNEFKVIKSTLLESKIYKTLEGPNRRLKLNCFEKRKTKIPRWNIMQGLKNVHGMPNEALAVCSSLVNTGSPFKIRSTYSKNGAAQKKHVANLAFKSCNKKLSEKLDSNMSSLITNVQNVEKNKNQETILENKNVVQKVNDSEVRSVGSSGCESDYESDGSAEQCPQISYNTAKKSQKKIPLTTINEESAEENSPSE